MSIPDNLLFKSRAMQIGRFRCPPSHPHFENTGPIRYGHLLVFPRTAVCITHVGGEPIIATPNVVMFYNVGQEYRRNKLSERGDFCDWFAFCPTLLADAIRPYEPSVMDTLERPFQLTHGPTDAHSYLLQRLIVEHLSQNVPPDPFYVEEMMLAVLSRVVRQSYHRHGITPAPASSATRRAHATLAHEIKHLLASHFRDALSLEQIATHVHASSYHLCRVFRQQTGQTIHHYLTQLRLRTALEQLPDSNTHLTTVALDLGFSSHSHFTHAFRRTFGFTPSALRRGGTYKLLRQLSCVAQAACN